MTYWRTFYHLVWATRHRAPAIDGERADLLRRSFDATCRELGAIVHAIGIMPDHVHLALSVPPRLAVAVVVRQLKGSSSHLLNHTVRHGRPDTFTWQQEYGVLTFGERALPAVVAYVTNQPRHHRHHDHHPDPDHDHDHDSSHHGPDAPWPTFERVDRDRDHSPGGASSR